MSPGGKCHLQGTGVSPILFCSPHHQLSMDVREQVHKIYVQPFFSKTCFKVTLLEKGAKGLRALSPPLIKAGPLTSAVWQERILLEGLSIEKCVG